MTTRRTYLPAAGHDWFLPLYDPLVKLLGGDRIRRALVDQSAVGPRHRVLEVGCGTGSLVVAVKRFRPDAEVVGLDPDPKALARARSKAEREELSIRFDQGFSDELPYPDASFDRVLSSLMFHHLGADEKGKTLEEVRRVLRPGGALHLLDLLGSEDEGGWLPRFLHSHHRLSDNSPARILALMTAAGFGDAREVGRGAMLFTRVAYYRATRV